MALTQQYVLLTGSDLGERKSNLELAQTLIADNIGKVLKTSEILESEAWGFESETKFLNQALLIETALKPLDILNQILSIEKMIGRIRSNEQWTSRIIDIDILCSGQNIFHTAELTIPHKFLHERQFALEPLCQIVAWQHPLLNKSYKEILSALSQNTLKPASIVD